MPAILSKNCIVGGELDWYCLACCALLLNTEDAVAHIQAAAHKHNLTELPYADKYKDDFIRKARGVYFCEVCEVTLPTAAKVGMHVTEATHVAGKTGRQLKRAGTAIVFQEITLITENAWNGLVDDTCVLCNVEFDDESIHKSQQSHILNLINSSVTAVGAANDIYRKVDGACQCLTCNKIVSETAITEHFNSDQHKNAIVIYSENVKLSKENNSKEIKPNKVTTENMDDTTQRVAENVQEATKNDSRKERKGLENAQPSKIDGKTLYTSPILIRDKNKAACSSDVTEVENLAKQHGLSMNKGSSNVYCSACSVHVTAALDRIKEHVDGKKHKGNMAKQPKTNDQKTKKIEKIPVEDFFTQFDMISNTDVVINDKFSLKSYHYLGYVVSHHRIYCQFCRVDLMPETKEQHLSSLLHLITVQNCFVIASLEKEFVREVRRDLYHCGYCGTVENDFDDMLDHLDTAEHKICRAERERMLPRHRARAQVQAEFTLDQLHHYFNNLRRF